MDFSTSPQHPAVGEDDQSESQKQTYATRLAGQNTVEKNKKLDLCPITTEQGIPTVEFTVDEVNSFTREEGLHQAIIFKFSYGKPELQELHRILPKLCDVKGNCNIGQLEFRHILVRFDLFDDFANVVSKTTGYVKFKGEEFFFRTFPWTMGFNPREETSKAVTWISFPELPANFFAKKSLLSIASIVGKPIAIDKATQDRSRPSTARVKIFVDLLDIHPKKAKIKIVDKKTGKIIEYEQRIVFDNLPKYCTVCNHQGHDAISCRWKSESLAAQDEETEKQSTVTKLKGDAREYLNANFARRRSEGILTRTQNASVLPSSDLHSTKENGSVTESEKKNLSVLADINTDKSKQLDTSSSSAVLPKGKSAQMTGSNRRDNFQSELTQLSPIPEEAIPGTESEDMEQQTLKQNGPVLQPVEPQAVTPELTTEDNEILNQNVIGQTNVNNTLKRNDPKEIEMPNFTVALVEKDFGSAEIEIPNPSAALDKKDYGLAEFEQPNSSSALFEKELQSSNRTDSICEQQFHISKHTEEMQSIAGNGQNEILNIQCDVTNTANRTTQNAIETDTKKNVTDRAAYQVDNQKIIADAEIFNQNTTLQPTATVALEITDPNEFEHPKEATALIEKDFQKDMQPKCRETVFQNELDQPKYALNSPDNCQYTSEEGQWSEMSKKTVSPCSKNKKQVKGSKSIIPSMSNSFDALNNINEDESQNSETKREDHAKDSKLKSVVAPTVPKRTKSSKSKTWNDQRDHDDDETWGEGLASFSWEEEDQGSEEDSEDSVKQKCQRKSVNKKCRAKLKQSEIPNSSLNHNAPIFVPSYNATAISSTNGTSKLKRSDTAARYQAGQIVTSASGPLEAKVNMDTNQFLNEEIGRDIFEEGEEEEMLSHCRAEAARRGDLSPTHSKLYKKASESEGVSRSERVCDNRMVVDRRPLMRVAKQKQAGQPFDSKHTRARNKQEG